MKFYTKEIKQEVPEELTIVAATKYFNPEEMIELYHTGITNFGENRVEILLDKMEALKEFDITWHIIGTLQTKKAKKIIDKIDCLHSLDTVKLAEEISKRRTSPLDCFIQVNISDEDSKHGLEIDEVIPFIKQVSSLPNINLIGLMGMASFTSDEASIHTQFQKLNDLQREIKESLQIELKNLSIGMSNDYKIALEHNATHLRLGSVLFKKEV